MDSAAVPSVESTANWEYKRQIAVDLDRDAVQEQLVLTSDVTVDARGIALWEDGHRWAVYVHSPTRPPIMLYSAFVPNGHVEVAILTANGNRRQHVLVQERTPDQLRILDIEYGADFGVRLSSAGHYHIQNWLPGAASLR